MKESRLCSGEEVLFMNITGAISITDHTHIRGNTNVLNSIARMQPYKFRVIWKLLRILSVYDCKAAECLKVALRSVSTRTAALAHCTLLIDYRSYSTIVTTFGNK